MILHLKFEFCFQKNFKKINLKLPKSLFMCVLEPLNLNKRFIAYQNLEDKICFPDILKITHIKMSLKWNEIHCVTEGYLKCLDYVARSEERKIGKSVYTLYYHFKCAFLNISKQDNF